MASFLSKFSLRSSKKETKVKVENSSPNQQDKKLIIDMPPSPGGIDLKSAPKGHQNYSQEDKQKCPFYSFQKGSNKGPEPQAPPTNQGADGEIPKKQKEQIPKGGCPFMPSEQKKNPGLQLMTQAWNEQFTSPFAYLLDYTGFFSLLRTNSKRPTKDRLVFDLYPIYLKHTLFFNDETMQKVRNLEVAQRFFAFDQLKEKGNKHYNRNEYQTALEYYERAFGVFQWLQYIEEKDSDEQGEEEELEAKVREDDDLNDEEEKKDKLSKEADLDQFGNKNLPDGVVNRRNQEKSGEYQKRDRLDTTAETTQALEDEIKQKKKEPFKSEEEKKNADIELEEQQKQRKLEEETLKQMKKHDKELRQQYKSLMIQYSDKNVFIRDGQDLTDTHDIDLRNSMLLNIYMNLACTYMKLFHFRLAEQVLSDAMQITDKNSQIYMRRSQAVSNNRWATLKELEQAQLDIQLAISMKRHEKVFNSEPGILRILNLQNHEEIYLGQANYVVKRIKERTEWESERMREMLEREKQIEEIEAEMIAEGQTPCEGFQLEVQGEIPMEREVAHEMLAKYYRIIEFYQETKQPDQVKIAKKELQNLCDTLGEMEFYYTLDFKKPDQNQLLMEINQEIQVDFSFDQIQRRLTRIQKERAKEVFQQGQFNFQVFEYALKDYFRRRDEREQKQLEREKQAKGEEENVGEADSKARRIINRIFSRDFIFHLFLLLIFLGTVFYFGRNNNTIKKLLFASKSK